MFFVIVTHSQPLRRFAFFLLLWPWRWPTLVSRFCCATVLLICAVVLLLASASLQKVSYGLDTPQDIYPGCFCFYEWNDANRVGNWIFEENWLQLEEPDAVGFVRISGDNTITLTQTRQVNQLTLGENRWDTTRLVLQEDLIIGMDARLLPGCPPVILPLTFSPLCPQQFTTTSLRSNTPRPSAWPTATLS